MDPQLTARRAASVTTSTATTSRKTRPDEGRPPLDRHSCADDRAGQVRDREHGAEAEQHDARRQEEHQRAEVRRGVDDLRRGRGLQEGEPDQPDQQEHEERAGSGAGQAVVEPDRRSPDDHHHALRAPREPRGVHGAELRASPGVDPDADQRDQHDDRQHPRRQGGREQRTADRTGERRDGHRHRVPAVDRHAAGERDRRRRRADDARQLVRRHREDRLTAGQHDEQRRELHEPATTDDRVDRAGEQRRGTQRQQGEQRHLTETGPRQGCGEGVDHVRQRYGRGPPVLAGAMSSPQGPRRLRGVRRLCEVATPRSAAGS